MNQPPQGGAPNSGQPQQPQYGQQPQGQYGQQSQGQYGQQSQGQYGRPQAQPPQYGHPGYGQAQYPQGQYQRPKTGPNKGLGVVKLLVGLCLSMAMLGTLAAFGYDGIAASLMIGVVLGLGLRWVATGAANVAGKKIPLLPSLGIIAVGAVVGALAGPPLSTASWESQEETAWSDLTSKPSEYQWAYIWDMDYFDKIPEQFQRDEARGQRKLAEVNEAIRDDNLVKLREHVYDIQVNYKGDENYREAFNAASGELKVKYEAVLEKLGKPGTETEFPVDEDLRKVFKDILTDLAEAPTSDVYVAFTNSSSLDAPTGHEEVLEEMKSDPSVRRGFPDGNVPVIQPGPAFSSTYDSARRSSFMEVTSNAFRSAFDANLLTLKTLEQGQAREDKLVMEVSSLIERTPTYFNYYTTDAAGVQTSNGLLFGVGVYWELTVYGRDGKVMYERKTYSLPGNNLFIDSQPTDPEWAVYSILMDSAYANYSREFVGSFGVAPPAEQQTFAFKDYSRSGG